MTTPHADQSETTQSLYENYNDYNKSLRAWFVSFGLGGPALFLVHPELVTSLRDAGVLSWTIVPFLIGCGFQIFVALINKYYAYYYYDSKVSSKPLHRFWDMIGEWFWLDILFDLMTVTAFAVAIGIMVDALVLTSPSASS
jgi:hypothetical protein